MKLPAGTKYGIEIDRRGCREAVFYDEDNQDFIQYVLGFGFKKECGTFSDISHLAGMWDLACVNVSAGYVSEHTPSEHLYLDWLEDTIQIVRKMLDVIGDAPVFPHKEKPWVPAIGRYDMKHLESDDSEYGQCDFCGCWCPLDEMFVYTDELDDFHTYWLCPDCAKFVRDDMREQNVLSAKEFLSLIGRDSSARRRI